MQIRELSKNLFGRPTLLEITLLPGVSVPIKSEDYRSIRYWLQDVQENLTAAEKEGMKPLSFQEILKQVDPDQLNNIVLFDTVPLKSIGNYWRITKNDEENTMVHLQLCGAYGNHDIRIMPEITIPYDVPMFTGISIHSYGYHDQPATLQKVTSVITQEYFKINETHPSDVKYLGLTILFSNNEGTLRPL